VVVGDGPYLNEMQTQTRSLPCTFTGYLEAEDLAMAYASADIFVFPSTTDTFGNVILEAQASGLPVIVTDQGGPCENMLPGKTGWVVKGNDWRAFAKGIETLIDTPEQMRQMAQAARQYAHNRSFDQAFDHHWQLYEKDDRVFRQSAVNQFN
jgi:glycosyltransferase involved in cell wall biosynthesis